jgi:hypothetical protein
VTDNLYSDFFFAYSENVGQDVVPRSSGHLAAPPKSHARLRAGHPMAGVHVASPVGPGLAPVVEVITSQL